MPAFNLGAVGDGHGRRDDMRSAYFRVHSADAVHVGDTLDGLAGTGLIFSGLAEAADNIREMRGTVFVNRRLANPSTSIKAGDLVTVAHGGKLSFVIDSDAYLLRGGSSMYIEKDEKSTVNGLRLSTGGLLAVFGSGEKTIRTRAATIGIRGTGIYLDTESEKTYFCTCYGETELSVNNDRRIMAAEHHHSAWIYTPHTGKTFIQDMGMFMGNYEYHTDDVLRAQEALVGRTVPFDK